MECRAFEFNTLKDYKYADIFAKYNGKWIFCKHKERTTWEIPGGHIETGETSLKAAERELFEETGAITYGLIPLCDYHISGMFNGIQIEGKNQASISYPCIPGLMVLEWNLYYLWQQRITVSQKGEHRQDVVTIFKNYATGSRSALL